MKLIHVFVMVVCFSVVQSQTTSKTTTKKRTTLKSTLSTTSKSTAKTTTKKPASTVSTIPPTTTFRMCGDKETTASTGFLQPLANVTLEESAECYFLITAPSDRQIQLSCSVLNFTDARKLTIYASADGSAGVLVKNRIYTSWSNEIVIASDLCQSDCWFNCMWKMIPAPPPNMTNFKMCRHGFTENAVGNIQPLDVDVEAPRTCNFLIAAPQDQQVQLTCSILNFTDTFPQGFLKIDSLDISPELELNRVYYSFYNQMILYFYRPVNVDWFRCNWTMVPNAPSTATDFRLCRHLMAQTENGTIQPMDGGIIGPSRLCVFAIIAPIDQYLRISCSVANFTSTRNFLRLSGIAYTDSLVTRLTCARPELNKVYTSTGNQISLLARIEDGNSFKCEWTTTTTAPTAITSTTVPSGIFKLCQNSSSTAANGTIQSLPYKASSSTKCSFTIQVPPDQRIQLSCSVIDYMTLRIDDVVVSVESAANYVNASLNSVYTSLGNQLRLTSFKNNPSDWIDCKWTTIPAISDKTTKFEMCRDIGTEKLNGTIQFPDWEPDSQCSNYEIINRLCSFLITAPPDYRVQLSCPKIMNVWNINYFTLNGTTDNFALADGSALPVFENRIYTSVSNQMYLLATVGEPYWALCSWTTIPKTSTTDFKLCLDREATSASGTIQPLDRKTGKPRYCPFTISLPPDNLILFTCPVVNLTSYSSLKLEGTAEVIDKPMANTIYVSTQNQISISSTMVNSDWFMCGWTSIKIYRICQERKANAATGIVQPNSGLSGLFNGSISCLFTVRVPSGRRVRMSCSEVNLNGRESSLEFRDELRNLVVYEPDVNSTYTSTGNRMFITANVDPNSNDWFSCQWLAV